MSIEERARQRRRVTPNHPELNQAVIPFVPVNSLTAPRNDNLALTGISRQHPKPSPKKTTKVIAVVTRPHDQIYLTEDDKGKQMVVQRAHNVAKVQRQQRDENYNPFDLRLRGKQRPAAVGVVGHIDNVAEEDALWRARQHMQNVQTQHSERHRPIQEEEERRLAEENRLKSLAKNEQKMKSYKVDMGHMLTIEEGAPSMMVEGAVIDGAGGLCNISDDKGAPNNTSFESYGEYIDDEVYDTTTEEDIKFEQPIANGTANNVLVREANTPNGSDQDIDDHIESAIDADNKYNVLVREGNTPSGSNQDMVSDVLARGEANSPGGSNQGYQDNVCDGQHQQESAIDDKVKCSAEDSQSEHNNFAYKQYNSSDSDSESSQDDNNPQDEDNINNDFMGDEQCLVVYEEQESNQAPPPPPLQPTSSGQIKKISEKEQRRITMNRQREMNIRQRQQQNMEQVIVDTAESRRQEAERKAEEERQKALALNEKKMKSYKVNMGYSLDGSPIPGTVSQRASSSSCSRQPITSCTTRSSSSQSSIQSVSAPKPLTKEEKERRRQAEMREKMLAARQRQQEQYEQLLENTAETRRQEAERKVEEARQKALALNEKKMKSYKVNMGYSLEDYLNQDNIEQENSASSNKNRGSEQMSSTMLTRESQIEGNNERNTGEKKMQQRVLNVKTDGEIARYSNETQYEYTTKDKAATTVSCTGSDSKDSTNARATVSKDTSCDDQGRVTVLNQRVDSPRESVNGEAVCDETVTAEIANETEQTETEQIEPEILTEEQRQRLFREQMLAARLKKQREMDLLVEQQKRKGK